MEFKKLELSDIERVRPFCERAESRTCDLSIGGLFIWRSLYSTEFAVEDGVFYSFLKDGNGKIFFNTPIAEDLSGALSKLKEHCAALCIPLRFCTVTEEQLPLFKELFPAASVTPQREFFDYLYDAEEMKSLRGKKFSGQRNHINRFIKTYEDYRFDAINEENISAARAFFEDFLSKKESIDESERAEAAAVFEILENYELYKMLGGVLFAGGRVAGFSLGERVGDTLIIHTEKADRNIHGAYQMLFCEFSKMYGEGVRYINREDDMGSEGLRRAKEALHPVCLLAKYEVAEYVASPRIN